MHVSSRDLRVCLTNQAIGETMEGISIRRHLHKHVKWSSLILEDNIRQRNGVLISITFHALFLLVRRELSFVWCNAILVWETNA